MAGTSRKRSAESDQAAPNAKRSTVKKSTQDEIIELGNYVSVSQASDGLRAYIALPTKFDVFPKGLCSKIEQSYIATFQSQLKSLENNTAWKNKYAYSLISDLRIRSSNPEGGITTTTLKSNMPTLSISNTALLDHFFTNHHKYLEDPSFVPLKVNESIANPDFSVAFGPT